MSNEVMKKQRKNISIVIFSASLITIASGLIVFALGCVWDRPDLMIAGLLAGVVGISLYYLSGDQRKVFNERLFIITKRTRLLILAIILLPIIVFAFFLRPLWKTFYLLGIVAVGTGIGLFIARKMGHL